MNSKTRLLLFIFSIVFFVPNVSMGQHSDCISAQNICAYGNYYTSEISGYGGAVSDFENSIPCELSQIHETNSYWFKWETSDYGFFSFVISPILAKDDIDFVLYSSASSDCSDKEEFYIPAFLTKKFNSNIKKVWI